MSLVKHWFKRNTHNTLFKLVSGFGRSINRMYENRNHHIQSNGEERFLKVFGSTDPKVILDVGANAGEYALLASKYAPNAHIYAFEPVDTSYAILGKNVAGNSNIHPINSGMFKNSGTQKINFYVHDGHSSLADISDINGKATRQIEIELLQGDEFLKSENMDVVDLLKVDVEGVEMDVFQGFENALRDHRIKVVQFEYGNINIISKHLLYDYYKYFESLGYVVGKIYPKSIAFRKYEFKHEDFIGPNFVAVSKHHPELIQRLAG